jgi:hypothetical protein
MITAMTAERRPVPRDLNAAEGALGRNATAEFTFNAVEFELLHQLAVTIDETAAHPGIVHVADAGLGRGEE